MDFGCGKSYLTFILYYYFAVKRGFNATIIGYDLKADVVQRCGEIARKYGYEGLEFVHADVTKDVLTDRNIDMIVTLHACDVATDYALAYAVNRGVKHIFSVPCCQHELNFAVKASSLPPVTAYGILKERFCALATDAVRAKLLESRGYEVQVLEFIDLSHSPKNLLIRAKKANISEKKRENALKDARTLLGQVEGGNTLLKLMGGKPAFVPKGKMRKTRPEDIDAVMALYDVGRQRMRASGNTEQWTNGYPHRYMIEEDVKLGRSYVYEEDGVLHAVFALIWGEDPTYAQIDGAWLSGKTPYGTIHRIATDGELPGLGSWVINWCLDLCGSIRIDTHEDNVLMRRALEKLGFAHCGTIFLESGAPRVAYEILL